MISKRTRFAAFAALTAGVLGMGVLASAPASAAQASHTTVSSHAKPNGRTLFITLYNQNVGL